MFGGRELRGKTLAVIGLGHIGASTARDATSLGMHVQGYDPGTFRKKRNVHMHTQTNSWQIVSNEGVSIYISTMVFLRQFWFFAGLSVQSALKLPREIALFDSIASAVAAADYVSINIPYIKGTPEEGGTHGIIGKDVLAHFKQDAVLLNFARGELVDSEAMREFLDNGNGVYISDFPDDLLWNHEKTIILPHLGASTAEAEDEAAKMAAETIIDYLEHGTVRNSVNFPSTNLPERSDNIIRLTVVNKNIPGMLSKITDCISKVGVNIAQQINQSRGDIAYNVIDLDPSSHSDGMSLNLKEFQREMTMLEGVLSTR